MNKLEKYFVTKIVLTFHCLNKLFWWSQNFLQIIGPQSQISKVLVKNTIFHVLHWWNMLIKLLLCKNQRLYLTGLFFSWTYFRSILCTLHCTVQYCHKTKGQKSYHQQVLRWSLPLSLRIMKVKGSFERPTPPNTVPMHNLLIWYLGGK